MEERNIKVSVIVPIYKVEKYLVQCLDSILNNTLKDIEVLLFDQCEIDACRAIIDMYTKGLKKDSRITAFHKKNNGYGAKVNMGINAAKGEYISIIEPDDFIEPTMFEEMYNYAKKLNADVVKTPYYEYKDATKDTAESKNICKFAEQVLMTTPQNSLFSVLDYPKLMQVHASLWAGLYRTAYIREKGIKFIEAKGSAYVDVGFRIDTLLNTDKVAWLNKPFYNYRISNQSSSTNSWNLSAMIQRWKEAHDKFNKAPELYNRIGKYLFYDEFYNTANYIFTDYKVTEDDFKKIKENFQSVPDNIILNTIGLPMSAKKIALKIKNSNKTLEYYKKRKYMGAWHSIYIGIHRKILQIHIFRYMRHNIFRCIFRISGIYVIDICLGKIK